MGGCASRPKDLDTTRQDPLLLPQDLVTPEAQTQTTSIQNDSNGEKVANEEPLVVDASEEEEAIYTRNEDVEEVKPASKEEKVEAITVHELETNVTTATTTTDEVIIVKANEEKTKDVPIVSI